VKLTLVIGQYAAKWHLGLGKETLTATVKNWKEHRPATLPLPHPSPRNNIWLSKNPWFAKNVIPALQARVQFLLSSDYGA
jgi:uracil-DNA glycosylase